MGGQGNEDVYEVTIFAPKVEMTISSVALPQ